MPKSVSISALASRFLSLLITCTALAGFSASAAAQAAPQLLPYTVTAVAGGGSFGNSTAGYYNNGTNTTCTYQKWSGTAYVATADANGLKPSDTVGDGCLYNEVALSAPRSAIADSEGNVFFIDSANNLFRRVDAHSGIVSTVGGVTIASTSSTVPTFASIASQATCPVSKNTQTDAYGDGCLATEVPMASPEALTFDAQGNLWFTDYYLGAVREIVKSTSIIQTVVNQSVSLSANPGYTSTGLNGFTWTANTGYVGYNATNANAAYGNVHTSATTYVTAAQALLYRPYGLAFDRAGNLYIGDNYNNAVDVVNLSNTTRIIAGYTIYPQEIFTIAGTGCPAVLDTYLLGETASSSTTPKQASMSCDSASYFGHSNGVSPYPSTGSTIDSPYQVAVDNSGNIYFADEYPYDVRVISNQPNYTTGLVSPIGVGAITTFAGVPYTGRKAYNAVTSSVATTQDLGSVYGVAVDPLGNVYIADYQSTSSNNCAGTTTGTTTCTSNYLERVDAATGELYAIAGQAEQTPTTAAIATNPAVTCSTQTDGVGDGCPGLSATVWKTYFPYVDAANNLYFGDSGNGLVRKLSSGTQFPPTSVSPTGVVQTLEIHFGVGDSSGAISIPASFADFTVGTLGTCTTNSDTSKNCPLPVTFKPVAAGLRTAPLTVTSSLGKVSTFNLTGTGLASALAIDPSTASTLASTNLTSVNDLALDAAGNAYAAVPGASSIVKITPAGVESNIGSSLSGANAVAVDGAGNVYAALSSGSVVEVPSNGGSQVALGSGFTDPAGIALDAYGNVFVSDKSANTVSEIVAGTGVQVTLASGLSSPTGVAVDSYGNVYVANTSGNTVVKVPFSGSSAVTVVASNFGLSAPLGLALDAAGSLYVADSGNSRIVYIPNESGTLNANDALPIVTGLEEPTGVAVTGGGTVYLSDGSASVIDIFTRSAANINFPAQVIAQAGVAATTGYASADIVSVGNQTAVFPATYFSAGTTNSAGDFTLTPTALPGSGFPAAGYGLSLTASFTPSAASAFTATYTFANTTPAAQPTLTMNGTGTNPAGSETMSLSTTVPGGQTSWIYGQTVVVNVTLTPKNPSWTAVPSGTITVMVDGQPYNSTQTGATTNGNVLTAMLTLTKLAVGNHLVSASCTSDAFYAAASTTASLPLPIALAQLNVQGETTSLAFDAAIPTLTGTVTGLQNGDAFLIAYSTPATAGSPVGAYAIVPSVPAAASVNYVVSVQNGLLNITPDSTVTLLQSSATSVNSTTQVTLTATVANQTHYTVASIPTGSVNFYNTVGTTTTKIGTATLNSSGVATITTSFAVTGASTNNSVTAVYGGDTNFVTSTSAGLGIVSGTPTFGLTQSTYSSLTVAPGQAGLFSFTLLPAFGYNGTIAFSCTAPATISCSFAPPSIVANGLNTSNVIAVTINSQTASSSLDTRQQRGIGGLPLSLAALPGLALLFGFGGLRRRLLRGSRSLLLLAVGLAALGFSGCSSKPSVVATPAGAQTITIVATGTGGSFASVTQQFNVTLNVQ